MNEQAQESEEFIKREPGIGTSQTMQNKCVKQPKTFKIEDGDMLGDTTFYDFEYQMTEQIAPVEIKKEMIEIPTIKHSDMPTKMDQDRVSENVQSIPKIIKQELENTTDVKVTYIKQEVSEYIQPKTESVVLELLTSECDLPALKIESTECGTDKYLGHTSSKKLLKKPSQIILKKKRYTCPICQNSNEEHKNAVESLKREFNRITDLAEHETCNTDLINKFVRNLKAINTRSQLDSFLTSKPCIKQKGKLITWQ